MRLGGQRAMALKNWVVQRKSPKRSLRAFLPGGFLEHLMGGYAAGRRIGHTWSRSVDSTTGAGREGAGARQLDVGFQVIHHVGGAGCHVSFQGQLLKSCIE